jgi:type I restriction enzyme S subunit
LNTGNVTKQGFDFSSCDYISEERDRLLRKGRVLRGDIVLTTRGTVGNVAFFDEHIEIERIRINSGMVIFRCDVAQLLPDYLFHFLRSRDFEEQVLSLVTGSAQPQLPIKDIHQIEIPIPSLADQERIVSIINSFEQRLLSNRRSCRILEEMSQTLFKSWFVDFDPVVAKSEGRKPFGMSDEIAALFPDSFEESELGAVPRGWRVGTISDIGENPRRGTKPSEVAPSTPYFGLEHLPRRRTTLDQWGCASSVVSGKLRFLEGEILFGKLRPYFHKVGVAPLDGVCSTDILVLRSASPEWFAFLLGHVSSVSLIEYVDAASSGTRMPRTDWRTIASYQIAIPDARVAEAFNQICAPLVKKCCQLIFENRLLAQARDTLLPRLLDSGWSEELPNTMLHEATAA